MEVLLLQDINGVGKKNDLLIVGDGYALNFLLPQSKAIVATPTVRRRFSEQIRRRAMEVQKERASAEQTASAVGSKSLTFARKVTKTGKLYAAITEKHIAEALQKEHGLEVEEKNIKIGDHIKALGDYEVSVKIGGASETLTIKVQAQK